MLKFRYLIFLLFVAAKLNSYEAQTQKLVQFQDVWNRIFVELGESLTDQELLSLIKDADQTVELLEPIETKIAAPMIEDLELVRALMQVKSCQTPQFDSLVSAMSRFGEYQSLEQFMQHRRLQMAALCNDRIKQEIDSIELPQNAEEFWIKLLDIVHLDAPLVEYLVGDLSDAENVLHQAHLNYFRRMQALRKSDVDTSWDSYEVGFKSQVAGIVDRMCGNSARLSALDIIPYTLHFNPELSVIDNLDREAREKLERATICDHLRRADVGQIFEDFVVHNYTSEQIFKLVFERDASQLSVQDVDLLLRLLTRFGPTSGEPFTRDVRARKRAAELIRISPDELDCSTSRFRAIEKILKSDYNLTMNEYARFKLESFRINCISQLGFTTDEELSKLPYNDVTELVGLISDHGGFQWRSIARIHKQVLKQAFASFMISKGINSRSELDMQLDFSIERNKQFCNIILDNLSEFYQNLHPELTSLDPNWPQASDFKPSQLNLIVAYVACKRLSENYVTYDQIVQQIELQLDNLEH